MKTLDDTGLHAVTCACAMCEAGYRPTMKQRWAARQALDARKRRLAAEAAAGVAGEARKSAAARAAQSRLSLTEDVRFTDRKLEELRAAERPRDPRTELYLALRAEGKSRSEAESIVDLRCPSEPPEEGITDEES